LLSSGDSNDAFLPPGRGVRPLTANRLDRCACVML
jgi:hypothetical protein